MRRYCVFVAALLVFSPLACAASAEMRAGAAVTLVERLKPDGSDKGIPAHPAMGDPRVSARIPSSSTGVIGELGDDSHANWIRISVGGQSHWIITKYVASVGDAVQDDLAYIVGCWNLEHFKKGAKRGFPEYLSGGPTIQPRTPQQLAAIAEVITGRIKASFLVLCEINGHVVEGEDGEEGAKSKELEELLPKLPEGWAYVISDSGGGQRVVFLYDESRFRLNEVIEFDVSRHRIQGSDIFARDPIAAHVTLLRDGQARNDLVIVGLHLASGQAKNRNHDAAMRKLLRLLSEAQEGGDLGGTVERDVILMGDLNCNMFSPPVEEFFLEMDDPAGDWDVLAGDDYPPTRLSGVPLQLRASRIDYIISSRAVRRQAATDWSATRYGSREPAYIPTFYSGSPQSNSAGI